MVPPGRCWLAGILGLLGLIAACRFDFERTPSAEEDGPIGPRLDGEGAVDGLPPLGPFGAPLEVTELSTGYGEDDPTLTADLLEIYYNSRRSGDVNIWRATRASASTPFDPPTRVAELSSAAPDSTPELSPNGLTIYLSRTLLDGSVNVLVSTRPARDVAWTEPVAAGPLNSPASDAGAAVTGDLLTLFFFSDRAGSYDLYVTVRATASSVWASPALVPELSEATAYDADPCPAFGGALVLYASDRGGDFELFAATRSQTGGFAAPAPIAELNTGAEERDPWISPDGRVVYFESFRNGIAHIYVATR